MHRTVRVDRERIPRWVAGFGERHGEPVVTASAERLRLVAPDGAVAELVVPFGPLAHPGDDPIGALVDHAARDRTVAALLVRRGGHAVGVFAASRLVASKVGSAYVQGRTKAGGWSQQRYARRRANQAAKAYAEAADDAAAVLLPRLGQITHLALGGDRRACAEVLDDPRLAPLRALAEGALFLPTPDPRLRVLEAFGHQLREVAIELNELA